MIEKAAKYPRILRRFYLNCSFPFNKPFIASLRQCNELTAIHLPVRNGPVEESIQGLHGFDHFQHIILVTGGGHLRIRHHL